MDGNEIFPSNQICSALMHDTILIVNNAWLCASTSEKARVTLFQKFGGPVPADMTRKLLCVFDFFSLRNTDYNIETRARLHTQNHTNTYAPTQH